MNRKTCPYLGLKDDPTTALGFPSAGNFCHHARPVAPVRGVHQQQYCLTANHCECPLFQAAQPLPMPLAMIAPAYSQARSRKLLAAVGIPALLAGSTLLAITLNGLANRGGPTQQLASANLTGAAEWSLLNNPSLSSRAAATPAPANPVNPAPASCQMPGGWVPYTVNPTDSLYRLSVIYGVSVEDMQRANCMGSNTTILPGEVIYVPFLPTDVPTPTPTATPFPTQVPTNPSADNNPPASAQSSSDSGSNGPAATPVPTTQPGPEQQSSGSQQGGQGQQGGQQGGGQQAGGQQGGGQKSDGKKGKQAKQKNQKNNGNKNKKGKNK